MKTSIDNKALVTGCAGFIGYHVTRRLLAEGYEVIGIDNLNDYYEVALKEARLSRINAHPRFSFYRLDLQDRAGLEKIFAEHEPHAAVNLAAQVGVRYSVENPMAYIESNIAGFTHLLECARQASLRHLVYASSSSVYGMGGSMPFTVRQNTDHPISVYAATKKANELLAYTYSHLYGLPVTGVRFFTVYGPWGRPDMAVFLFARRILEGKPIQVFNEGGMSRDFTYIDDAVECVSRLLRNPPAPQADLAERDAPFRVLNVGSGRPVSLLEMISLLEDKLGKKAVKEWLPIQAGDVKETFADTDDLEQTIGFVPNTRFSDGINEFVTWFKQYYGV